MRDGGASALVPDGPGPRGGISPMLPSMAIFLMPLWARLRLGGVAMETLLPREPGGCCWRLAGALARSPVAAFEFGARGSGGSQRLR